MDRLTAHGIEIDVPPGWEAELSVRGDDPLVVIHAANFWMPAERADYASEVLDVMGFRDIFISLIEFETAPRFASQGIPDKLDPEDYSRSRLPRRIGDLSGAQHFFSTANRAFCLHVVIGSHGLRRALGTGVNRFLSGLSIVEWGLMPVPAKKRRDGL